MMLRTKTVALAAAAAILLPGCTTTGTATAKNQAETCPDGFTVRSVERGIASWYSIKTNRGTKTASGQRLCNYAPTAAHKTLPMGTKVRVTNTMNGKSEVVTINDRGPFIRGRVIDVTVGTAERLGFRQRGIVPVKVEVLDKPKPKS